jgi:hypothetical protein
MIAEEPQFSGRMSGDQLLREQPAADSSGFCCLMAGPVGAGVS